MKSWACGGLILIFSFLAMRFFPVCSDLVRSDFFSVYLLGHESGFHAVCYTKSTDE